MIPGKYSYLFLPAGKAESFFKKIIKNPNDYVIPKAIIFDLEDSVLDDQKVETRILVKNLLEKYSYTCQNMFGFIVRINNPSSDFFRDDITWLSSFDNRNFRVKIPKCSSEEDLRCMTPFHSQKFPLIPTIETLAGYENRIEIMSYGKEIGVIELGFGAGDMAFELNIDRDYNLPVLTQIISNLIISSKLFGLKLLDSTSRVLPSNIKDWKSEIEEEVNFACSNGFAGKKAIHPGQLSIIEEIFKSKHQKDLLSAEEILKVTSVNKATRANKSVITGDYFGYPSIKLARQIKTDS